MSEYWRARYRRHVAEAGTNRFRQVGRTLHQQPMSEEMLRSIATQAAERLELGADCRLLDFCCGNGLLTVQLAPQCRQVVGVDFNEALIAALASRAPGNVVPVVADASQVCFRAASFDRILFAAAAQHFSQPQMIRLMIELADWLKPGGILLLTDVLDPLCMWRFYDSEEREDLYFRRTMEETPIMGTWLDRTWMEKLARHAGFARVRAVGQSKELWYSHYRYDLVCRK